MHYSNKNQLVLTSNKGCPIIAIWPPCGESVLAEAVDFKINKTNTSVFIRQLFPENRCEELAWGFSRKGYQVFDGHWLNNVELNKLREWLKTREMPKTCLRLPRDLKRLIKTMAKVKVPDSIRTPAQFNREIRRIILLTSSN